MSMKKQLKIMFVDISTDGHHLIYLASLLQAASKQSFAVLPEGKWDIAGRYRNIPIGSVRSFGGYSGWIKKLKEIAGEEQPDIIHFLDGDSIMRYFGMGLGQLSRQSKIVITFHHLFPGELRKISMRFMLRKAACGVVHTDEIQKKVRRFGCKNVRCIPYPCFLNTPMAEGIQKRNEVPVLLALGGTRYDKGLDILLEALRSVTEPFRLVIAGKEEDFKEDYIKQQVQAYQERVEINLSFLSEKEVLNYLQKANIIVLPYRRIFDGASGPLCEGVYLGKTIIGPSHGSLGKLILEQHVGFIFESENAEALAECLNKALKEEFIYDKVAKTAQEELKPEIFLKRYKKLYEEL